MLQLAKDGKIAQEIMCVRWIVAWFNTSKFKNQRSVKYFFFQNTSILAFETNTVCGLPKMHFFRILLNVVCTYSYLRASTASTELCFWKPRSQEFTYVCYTYYVLHSFNLCKRESELALLLKNSWGQLTYDSLMDFLVSEQCTK